MWIDIHAHLDRLPENELRQRIAEAAAAGVTIIVSAATDLMSAEAVAAHCTHYDAVYGTAGISPFDSACMPDDWESRLKTLLSRKHMIALGEIGLDRTNPRYPPLETQLPPFEKQLVIAKERNIPVVVHSRGVETMVADLCRSVGIQKALFHCFTGTRDDLERILEYGYCISFSGIVTFDSNVRGLISHVPLDRLFIETDSPYLAPVPFRGQTNHPALVVHTGEMVAREKNLSPGQLQEALECNFRRLFLSKDSEKDD